MILEAGGDFFALLEKFAAELPGLFIVSQVEVKRLDEDTLSVRVERARGDKCERCWKFKTDVGSDADWPTVCASCAQILREYF